MPEIGRNAPRNRASTEENVEHILNPELREQTAALLRRLHNKEKLRPGPSLEMSGLPKRTLTSAADREAAAAAAAAAAAEQQRQAIYAQQQVPLEAGRSFTLRNPLPRKTTGQSLARRNKNGKPIMPPTREPIVGLRQLAGRRSSSLEALQKRILPQTKKNPPVNLERMSAKSNSGNAPGGGGNGGGNADLLNELVAGAVGGGNSAAGGGGWWWRC